MICSGVLFALLLMAYFMHADNTKKLGERKAIELEKAYSDKNLTKMEYDVAVYDEEVHEPAEAGSHTENGTGKPEDEEEAGERKAAAEEILFGKVDDEGMEEITGNFKGDEN